jgi:hypothetical protein
MTKLSLRANASGGSPTNARQPSLLAEVWQQQDTQGTPQQQRVRVPVASEPVQVEVGAGPVLVNLRLPSGKLYSVERTIEPGVDQEVVFDLGASSHEWQSWNRYFDRGQSARPKVEVVQPPTVELPPSRVTFRGARAGVGDSPAAVPSFGIPGMQMAAPLTLAQRAAAGKLELVVSVDGNDHVVDLTPALTGGPVATDRLSVQADSDEQSLSLTFTPLSAGFDRRVRHQLYLAFPSGSVLAPLPVPWMGPPSAGNAPVPVQIILTVDEDDAESPRPQLVIQDPDFGPLLAYFQAGDRGSARAYEDELAALAKDAMASDLQNPIPAIAGAYVLLRLGRLDYVRSWLDVLANNAPFADGPILVATALLAESRTAQSSEVGGGVEAAAQRLLDASGRGLPLFSTGVNLLREGLRLAVARLSKSAPDLLAKLEVALDAATRMTEVQRPGFFLTWLEGEADELSRWIPAVCHSAGTGESAGASASG